MEWGTTTSEHGVVEWTYKPGVFNGLVNTWLVKSMRPYRILEDPSFREIIGFLHPTAANDLESRRTFKNRLFEAERVGTIYIKEVNKIII
jgi:hypothetical protein